MVKTTPPENPTYPPEKWMVGSDSVQMSISYWNSSCFGDMLIFRGVAGVLEGMSPEAEGIYLLKFSSQKKSAEELAATPQGF